METSRKETIKAVLQGVHKEIIWKGKRISVAGVMQKQAKLLRQHIEGKTAYTPYLYKW